MTRVFTKDMGRWKQGEVREYPITTWKQIEESVRQSIDSFSKELLEAVRGTVKPIQRTINVKTT